MLPMRCCLILPHLPVDAGLVGVGTSVKPPQHSYSCTAIIADQQAQSHNLGGRLGRVLGLFYTSLGLLHKESSTLIQLLAIKVRF